MPFPAYSVFGPDGLKQCTKCEYRLPADAYSADKRNTVTGLQTWCKNCVSSHRPVQILNITDKLCPKCRERLPISCFGVDKKSKTGLKSRCKKCNIADSLRRHRKLRGTVHYEYVRREEKLRRKYGMSQSMYVELLSKQNGVCAICKQDCMPRRNFDIDHCHKTGRIRGLLCRRCNLALGLFYDNPLNLIKYSRGDITTAVEVTSLPSRHSSQRRADLKRRYDMTEGEYELLWKIQGGVCCICLKSCSSKSLLSVDHCHDTGRIRALLCKKCNVAVALLRDNTTIFDSFCKYIASNV